MQRRGFVSLRFVVAALVAAVLSGPAMSAEEGERLRQLEERLHSVTEELNAIKTRQGEIIQDRPAQPAPQTKAEGVKARFNEGIVFEDPSGDWSLRLGGRAQLDYRSYSPRESAANTFSLRRARMGVDATLYKDYRIVVEAEFANGNATGSTAQNVALTNGYFDIGAFGPGARIRLGQFKPAFGYEQTQLDLYSDFQERSFGQSLLQNLNYDRGAMLYGTPVRGLWYGLTLSNGVGQNFEEKQANAQEVGAAKPELTARIAGNLAALTKVQDLVAQIGTSYKHGVVANSAANPYTAASIQTEARGVTFFTPAAFNATGSTADNIDRTIKNYEFLLSWGSVKVQGEKFEATYQGRVTSALPPVDFKRRLEADYISVTWLVTGEKYADFFRDGIITKIRPKSPVVSGQSGGRGAWELGIRYSTFNGTDFASTNPPNTGRLGAAAPVTVSANEAEAATFQVKWIPNVYTRFWMDVINTKFKTPVTVNGKPESNEKAVVMRAQMDF